MILKSKTLRSVVQPLHTIDKLLRMQGFRPVYGDSSPAYDVILYDSATSRSYFLRIPTNISHADPQNGELIVRLGSPSLKTKALTPIPEEVRQAAVHKVAEIADYLASQPRREE